MPIAENEVFARVGEAGLTRLVAAFFKRIPHDDILSKIYPPHDLAGAEARLLGFLIYRFGGPADYIEQRGHPRLRMRHAPFQINRAAAERWYDLMHASLTEVQLDREAAAVLDKFLRETATFLINQEDE
jgi:hemoglobin